MRVASSCSPLVLALFVGRLRRLPPTTNSSWSSRTTSSSPAEIVVPAGKKVKLVIENRDATPEEFESNALKREKVIAGKSTATIFIGPLKPGSYPFVGEYNEKTAKGVDRRQIDAREPPCSPPPSSSFAKSSRPR